MSGFITDRTEKDVVDAKLIRDEKLKTFSALTQAEIDTLNRGMMTADTIERIEQAAQELWLHMDAMWYKSPYPDTYRDSNIYRHFHINRDVKNIISLCDHFIPANYGSLSNFYEKERSPIRYQDLNDIEYMLENLENMIYDAQMSVRECGAYECGEDE